MWWQSLPSAAIIGGCLALIPVLFYFENKLVLGTPYKRQLTTSLDNYVYLRDYRLSGHKSAYTQFGLDCIPDVNDKGEVVVKKIECVEKEQ